MAVTHLKSGTIQAILYFRHHQTGKIYLLPSDEDSRRFRFMLEKLGYEFCVADTLQQAGKLQKDMNQQLYDEQQLELMKDEFMTTQRRQAVRDRLVARANAVGTPPMERDFIMGWLVMREQRHDIFRKRFTSQFGVLNALEYDSPDKHVHDLHDRVKNSGE